MLGVGEWRVDMECGECLVVYGWWWLVSGVRNMNVGGWKEEDEGRRVAYEWWKLVGGVWSMNGRGWSLEDGIWRVEDDVWMVEVSGWRVEYECCRLEVGG